MWGGGWGGEGGEVGGRRGVRRTGKGWAKKFSPLPTSSFRYVRGSIAKHPLRSTNGLPDLLIHLLAVDEQLTRSVNLIGKLCEGSGPEWHVM